MGGNTRNNLKARGSRPTSQFNAVSFQNSKGRGGTRHGARSRYYIQWPVREEELEAQGRLLLLDRWGPSAFETAHRAVKRTYWAQTSLNQFTATLWKSLWSKHNRVPPRRTWSGPMSVAHCATLEWVGERKKKTKKPPTEWKNKPRRPTQQNITLDGYMRANNQSR